MPDSREIFKGLQWKQLFDKRTAEVCRGLKAALGACRGGCLPGWRTGED